MATSAWRATLLGCDDGLAALSGLLDRVANRHGGALAVSGDAGIGKSSLVAGATAEVSRRAMCVLTTTGFQAETHDPYAGLHGLSRSTLDTGCPRGRR